MTDRTHRRRTLSRMDRELITVWAEHGIPADPSTLEHAAEVLRRLTDELETAWEIIDQLTTSEPTSGQVTFHLPPNDTTASVEAADG